MHEDRTNYASCPFRGAPTAQKTDLLQTEYVGNASQPVITASRKQREKGGGLHEVAMDHYAVTIQRTWRGYRARKTLATENIADGRSCVSNNDDSVADAVEGEFKIHDINGDGTLSRYELDELWEEVFQHMSAEERRKVSALIWEELGSPERVSVEDLMRFVLPAEEENGVPQGDLEMLILVNEGAIIPHPPVTLKGWVWALLNIEVAMRYVTRGDWLPKAATAVQTVSQIAICISIINMIVESEPSVTVAASRNRQTSYTFFIEAATVAFFTVEFLVRTAAAPVQREYWSNPYTLIDLMAIVPFYLTEVGLTSDNVKSLSFFRIVRLTRLLRILKVGRHSVGIHLLVLSMANARFALLCVGFVVVLTLVLLSGLMWSIETSVDTTLNRVQRRWQRNEGSEYYDAGEDIAFQSMPSAMWWGIQTITTTGYGDMTPATHLGKAVGALSMIGSVIILAFPTTILTQEFCRVYRDYGRKREQHDRKEVIRQRLVENHTKRNAPVTTSLVLKRGQVESLAKLAIQLKSLRAKRSTQDSSPSTTVSSAQSGLLIQYNDALAKLEDELAAVTSSLPAPKSPMSQPSQSCTLPREGFSPLDSFADDPQSLT